MPEVWHSYTCEPCGAMLARMWLWIRGRAS